MATKVERELERNRIIHNLCVKVSAMEAKLELVIKMLEVIERKIKPPVKRVAKTKKEVK